MGQSIFSNALIATLGRVVTLGCGLVATGLMTRILGVEDFGAYALLLSIGAIIQLTADFGLYLTLSRELGISHGTPTSKIGNIASLRLALLVGIFGAGLVMYFVLPYLRPVAGIFCIISLGLIFQSISQLLMAIFQAYGSVWRATAGDIVGRMVQVGFLGTIWLILPIDNVLLWVSVAFTAGLACSLIIHLLVVPERRLLRVSFSLSAWREIARVSWPIALMLILNVIYFRIDTVLLSSLRTPEEVGLYSLAYKIIENGLFFPAMIGGLLLPSISSALARTAQDHTRKLIEQGLALSLSGAAILITILMVFSGDIVMLLGGTRFHASSVLLRILAIALGSMFLGNIFGFTLIALQKQKQLAVLYGILAISNIVANLALIPIFGAIGASWVTVATEISATIAAASMVWRHIQWTIPMRTVVASISGVATSALIAIFLLHGMNLWIQIISVLLAYLGIMYVSGAWSASSLSILRKPSSL